MAGATPRLQCQPRRQSTAPTSSIRPIPNHIYRALVERFGAANTYILSAGWGLIPATFLTPWYDITFSMQAQSHVRRRKRDLFFDFAMMPKTTSEEIVCFGSKEYVPLFAALTRDVRGGRTVFYNSATPPSAPGCKLVRFETRTRTNWQYECAGTFLNAIGRLQETDTSH